MRILVRDGNDLIDSKTFEPRRVTIGSGEACDLRIRDRRLPDILAALQPHDDGEWLIESVGDTGILQLNGRPVIRAAAVKHSDEIAILNYTIAVYRSVGEKLVGDPVETTMISAQVSALRAHPLPAGSIVKHDADIITVYPRFARDNAALAVALPKCTDIAKLIDMALDSVLHALGGRTAYIGIRRNNYGPFEFEQGRGVDGKSTGEPSDFDNFVYRCIENRQFICVPSWDESAVGTALAAPIQCERGELGILYVDRRKGAPPFTAADLDRLTMMTSLFGAQLEKIIMGLQEVQSSVQAGRLSFMREVQTRMDPSTVPQWPGLQLAAYCKPGAEQSGDVYDVMRLPNGLAGLFVANISGEATRAAMAMAEVRAAFRIGGLHADSPHVFLRAVNWMLCEERVRCPMNAVAVMMNPRTGVFECATAGKVGVIVVDQRGESRDLVERSAPQAGQSPGFVYHSKSDKLGVGETLGLFTAGCCMVRDAAGETLGEERFAESVRDGFGQSATTAMDELIQDHTAFFKDGRQPDDITILLLHRASGTH